MSGLRRRPDAETEAAWTEGANRRVAPGEPTWKAANERAVVGINLRLPERLHLQLKYIVENSTGRPSIQKFVLGAVENAVVQKLKELGVEA